MTVTPPDPRSTSGRRTPELADAPSAGSSTVGSHGRWIRSVVAGALAFALAAAAVSIVWWGVVPEPGDDVALEPLAVLAPEAEVTSVAVRSVDGLGIGPRQVRLGASADAFAALFSTAWLTWWLLVPVGIVVGIVTWIVLERRASGSPPD